MTRLTNHLPDVPCPFKYLISPGPVNELAHMFAVAASGQIRGQIREYSRTPFDWPKAVVKIQMTGTFQNVTCPFPHKGPGRKGLGRTF